tara:strand:- start:1099 stop:1413 length:315 start_codon:yes stop_codon:yes gene_type:complete
MNNDKLTINVEILGKEYQVSCAPDEVDQLTASANLLNRKMQEIRSTGKVVGLDRVAVMASLNMASELLALRSQNTNAQSGQDQRVEKMADKIRSALSEHKQLHL